jgi:uncharacterized protein
MSAVEIGAIAAVTAALALLVPAQPLVPFAAATIGLSLAASTSDGEAGEWFAASWGFAKQIFPLLLLGILAAGLLLGRPGHEGLIPADWVASRWAATPSVRTCSLPWRARSCTSRR